MITIKGYRKNNDNPQNKVLDVSREVDEEIITLAEAKRHLRIDFTDEDQLITGLITASRIAIENYVQLSLVPCEVTALIQNEISGIKLPWGPYVDGLELRTEDDVLIDPGLYKLRGGELFQYSYEIFQAKYNAGYDEDTLPADLKLAILNQLTELYENRGEGKLSELSKRLCTPYKTNSWVA